MDSDSFSVDGPSWAPILNTAVKHSDIFDTAPLWTYMHIRLNLPSKITYIYNVIYKAISDIT